MKKYKHKPTIVEAIQWLGNTPAWRNEMKAVKEELVHAFESNRRLIVCTHWAFNLPEHKSFVLEHGDWLVKVRGEWVRVEQCLFEQLYEEMSDED